MKYIKGTDTSIIGSAAPHGKNGHEQIFTSHAYGIQCVSTTITKIFCIFFKKVALPYCNLKKTRQNNNARGPRCNLVAGAWMGEKTHPFCFHGPFAEKKGIIRLGII